MTSKGQSLFFKQNMKQYGIIGFPLSHSFSPNYFNQKFEDEKLDCCFEAFPIQAISEFPELLKKKNNLCGLSVTIPYKTTIIPYLDELSKEAKSIGAINCVHIIDGKTIGHNTDFIGFANSLKPLLTNNSISSALVLGTGGASKAICYALSVLNIPYTLVSRTAKGEILDYESIDEKIIKKHLLIINTTPLGMYPNIDECPNIPYQFLTHNHLLFDLVYNPEETLFLKKGKQQNALISNGLQMLIAQAEVAWKIWNQK